ncbi:Smr/MutS family protein [Legionella clemsonensis]|uniref:Putative DNA endonuclease SmrA n=1 Tax=Legionella clemsonensis TaxID=1867846 RepID=A0A222P4U9_9GAMM|nr:Smr/MutS family protein [Legionella clemsonensis]ASQ46805.1 putative DNA endonuclease SmrA [Legionella clemsonensis]
MSDDFLSEEDKVLFRKMAGIVKPLQPNKKINTSAEKLRIPAPKVQKLADTKTDHGIYLSDYYINEVQADTLLSYCSHSIPGKRFRELKNGQIKWDSRLDLHGLKPETARETLINFIIKQHSLAHRCLLIIHGKGSHNGETPVLKNLVNHWLRQFPHVLAFHSALGRDGGSGALYVLLKRRREDK